MSSLLIASSPERITMLLKSPYYNLRQVRVLKTNWMLLRIRFIQYSIKYATMDLSIFYLLDFLKYVLSYLTYKVAVEKLHHVWGTTSQARRKGEEPDRFTTHTNMDLYVTVITYSHHLILWLLFAGLELGWVSVLRHGRLNRESPDAPVEEAVCPHSCGDIAPRN